MQEVGRVLPGRLSTQERIDLMLSVIVGSTSIAEAAARADLDESLVEELARSFVEGGLERLGGARYAAYVAALRAESAELRTALREAAVEIKLWQELERCQRTSP
ncbi:hypothetical protein [Streptomyces alfalfae]